MHAEVQLVNYYPTSIHNEHITIHAGTWLQLFEIGVLHNRHYLYHDNKLKWVMNASIFLLWKSIHDITYLCASVYISMEMDLLRLSRCLI